MKYCPEYNPWFIECGFNLSRDKRTLPKIITNNTLFDVHLLGNVNFWHDYCDKIP